MNVHGTGRSGLAWVIALALALASAFAQASAQGIRSLTEERETGGPGALAAPSSSRDPLGGSALGGSNPLQPGAVDPERYRLGPGDVLSLEMSGRVVRQVSIAVDAEGFANFPEFGVLRTGGRTLSEVRTQVLARLRAAYPGARVDLRLVGLRQFKVYVAGLVLTPGVTAANGATRASELLQGPMALAEGASRRNLELRHANGTSERVDLDAFSALGRTADNPFVLDGDVLWVPPRTQRVYALGAFGRPGEFELAPGDSVLGLVELAGGLLPGAEPASGRLYRFTSPAQTDSLALDLGDSAQPGVDRPLQDGDRLFVRENSDYHRVRNVTLVGEVVYPGPYAIREGVDRIGDVLARAGGMTQSAAPNRIQVFRPLANAGSRRDIEFERLSRLSRIEMTNAEYQTFKTKLAAQEATYVLSFDNLKLAGGSHDVLLKDGDLILVDRESHAVRVDGQVLRPSLVEYVPGRTVEQYIELAGGFGQRAWKRKIRITRAGSNQTLYRNDARDVQPGDFIWVPEKNDVSFWGVVKDVITVAGAAATIILVVRGR